MTFTPNAELFGALAINRMDPVANVYKPWIRLITSHGIVDLDRAPDVVAA